MCLRCLRTAGPTAITKWLAEGQCPGSPAHRRTAFFNEGPLARSRVARAQSFLDVVVEVVVELAQYDIGPLESQGILARGLRGIHASHLPRSKGTYTWCRRCGAWTSGLRIRLLARPCLGPAVAGRLALARISKGLPPRVSETEWGDEAVPKGCVGPSDDSPDEEG